MGLNARKPVLGVYEQQRCRPVCASTQTDKRLCCCFLESIISKLAMNQISISSDEETGLSLNLSEIPKTGFIASRLIYSCINMFINNYFTYLYHYLMNWLICTLLHWLDQTIHAEFSYYRSPDVPMPTLKSKLSGMQSQISSRRSRQARLRAMKMRKMYGLDRVSFSLTIFTLICA